MSPLKTTGMLQKEVVEKFVPVDNKRQSFKGRANHAMHTNTKTHMPIPLRAEKTDKTVKPYVLVVINHAFLSQQLMGALNANNIGFQTVYASTPMQHWPSLENQQTGKFSVIIFQSIRAYHKLNGDILTKIHEYCFKYDAGIVAFAQKMQYSLTSKLGDLPMIMEHRQSLRDISVNSNAGGYLHITKAGQGVEGLLPYSSWTVFTSNHSSYRSIVQARQVSQTKFLKQQTPQEGARCTTMLLDEGHFDGIRRIFIGNDLRFWLHYILFLDSISYLSHGLIKTSLDRYIQVDIDDIFVGKNGRLTELDVQAVIHQQRVLANKVPGFTFKLGFSGRHFGSGNEDEKKGDQALAENAETLSWFPHTWGHTQAHQYDNRSRLISEMMRNYQFAKSHNITVDESYAVAPHHSGVYPAHDMLYDAWREVWGIKVTSTEEYPALTPDWNRKGFIFKNIMVLPRQTCTLFTKNMLMSNYTGGKAALDAVIQGGEVFHTIISNPISVFMTHMPNYAHDRLALYLFDELVTFIQKWTHIELKTAPPLKLAQMYFEMYPREREPMWTNPCTYRRHLDILPKLQSCDRLPHILVLGPQKTGTAALHAFMSMHPNLASNYPSKETYEEVQFFSNSQRYAKGLEWYMSNFPHVKDNSTDLLFEKSATYFDSENAPMRAHVLLNSVKLITILIDPAKRAYSWYQHERARENPAGMNFTFYDVITSSGPKTHRMVVSLRNRCLNPGNYVKHLSSWLSYYSAKQMLVVDGDLLKTDPVVVMTKVQHFLGLTKIIDFKDKIIFDKTKGFFCPVKNGRTKCLAKNKGRSYPPMDSKSKEFLHHFYQDHNSQLRKYLKKIGKQLPQWLREK